MPSDKSKESPLVTKLVKDPKAPPKTILMAGFLGRSSLKGHQRLYFDAQLSDWVEIPDAAVLHTEELPQDAYPWGGAHVWVARDATLVHGGREGAPSGPPPYPTPAPYPELPTPGPIHQCVCCFPAPSPQHPSDPSWQPPTGPIQQCVCCFPTPSPPPHPHSPWHRPDVVECVCCHPAAPAPWQAWRPDVSECVCCGPSPNPCFNPRPPHHPHPGAQGWYSAPQSPGPHPAPYPPRGWWSPYGQRYGW